METKLSTVAGADHRPQAAAYKSRDAAQTENR
jgi:hypothetical protein